jgi:putative phosphoesterase
MKIGVISDTHLREPSEELERIVLAHFSDVDMILHAGDFISQYIVDFFRQWNLIAVCGNMDAGEVKSLLPGKRVIDVSDFKIGLIHGWGSPIGLEKLTQVRQLDPSPAVTPSASFPWEKRSKGKSSRFNRLRSAQ